MIKSHPKSRLEVWRVEYLLQAMTRQPEDENVTILQIETGKPDGNYIVEIVDNDDFDPAEYFTEAEI